MMMKNFSIHACHYDYFGIHKLVNRNDMKMIVNRKIKTRKIVKLFCKKTHDKYEF